MTTLTDMVLNKHELSAKIAEFIDIAGESIAENIRVNDHRLLDLMGRFYDHERFVRGCSHTAAARETVEELDRVRESMTEVSARKLQGFVMDKLISYADFQAWQRDAEREAQAIMDSVRTSLESGGMGTDPAYRVIG